VERDLIGQPCTSEHYDRIVRDDEVLRDPVCYLKHALGRAKNRLEPTCAA